jgi:hypothetical protein
MSRKKAGGKKLWKSVKEILVSISVLVYFHVFVIDIFERHLVNLLTLQLSLCSPVIFLSCQRTLQNKESFFMFFSFMENIFVTRYSERVQLRCLGVYFEI